jgi:hypothetical protein
MANYPAHTTRTLDEQESHLPPDTEANIDVVGSVQSSHLSPDAQVNIDVQERDLSPDTEANKSVHQSEVLPHTASHLGVLDIKQGPTLKGNKSVRKTKADTSEAARRIQRILRRNPNTGPTELAAKAGVSRGYASQVKSQFLTQLAAEQSA